MRGRFNASDAAGGRPFASPDPPRGVPNLWAVAAFVLLVATKTTAPVYRRVAVQGCFRRFEMRRRGLIGGNHDAANAMLPPSDQVSAKGTSPNRPRNSWPSDFACQTVVPDRSARRHMARTSSVLMLGLVLFHATTARN